MSQFILKQVSSKNTFGTMNGSSIRYTNLTEADKKRLQEEYKLATMEEVADLDLRSERGKIFVEHRKNFAEANGFDYKKMFMADQKTQNGSYFELTPEYIEANPNGWTDIDEDILIITDKAPGVVAGHPVADCPVLMVSDVKQNVTAVCHCSADLIDKQMPMMTYNAIKEAYDSDDENLIAYVSACAGKSWTYNNYPKWATDEVTWKNAIVEKDGVFYIDIRKAMANQLAKTNMGVFFDKDDTITDSRYYSNYGASEYGLNKPEKFGRSFEGALYQDISENSNLRRK